MKTYNQTLDSLGLARELFDVDNKERIEHVQQLHAEMSKRMRELEAQPEWQGRELPWSQARAEYLAENAEDAAVGAEAVMSQVNGMWLSKLRNWCREYQAGFYRMSRALQRTEKRWSNQPEHASFRLNQQAAARGIDLEKVREDYRLRKAAGEE